MNPYLISVSIDLCSSLKGSPAKCDLLPKPPVGERGRTRLTSKRGPFLAADLVHRFNLPVMLDLIRIASYYDTERIRGINLA